MSAVRTFAPPTPEERPFPAPIRLQLRRRVLALDYRACSKLVCRLLDGMGYEQVRPAGRTSLLGYNRPGGGGWDLTATLPAGVGSRHVVIRLKHSPIKHSPCEHSAPDPKPVHQRCVDELRGACLRAGAAEGLLVATCDFSLTARRLAAREQSGVALVRLVDGEELVDLLLAHRVGVRETRLLLGRSYLEMDEDFFHSIQGADAARPARPGEHRRENVRRENLRRLASLCLVVRLGGDDTDADDFPRRQGRPRGSR